MTNEELHATWPEYVTTDGDWMRSTDIHQMYMWGIWIVVSGSTNREVKHRHGPRSTPFQLQRYNVGNNEVFTRDEQAWLHVWRLAQAGGSRERAALFFLRHKSPVEYEQLRKYCMEHA